MNAKVVNQTPATDAWRWILIVKGIGIFLVVLGHFKPWYAPAWWTQMVALVYTFHMPLFMFVSGFLYTYGKVPWTKLAQSKLWRLGLPFISIGIIFFAVKLLAGKIVSLDHPIGPHSLWDVLINPAESYMPLLWFMHALLLMFLTYPLLRLILRKNLFIFLALVVLNTLWQSTDYPGLARVLAHYPFFVAGIWLRESGQLDLIRKPGWLRIGTIAVVLFFVFAWLLGDADISDPTHYPLRLLLGLSGALLVIAIARRIDLTGENPVVYWMAQAGFYSMTIYLLHTLFLSGVRVGAFQMLGLSHIWFLPVALIAVAVGMGGPWLLEKYVLRKLSLTRVAILGLKG